MSSGRLLSAWRGAFLMDLELEQRISIQRGEVQIAGTAPTGNDLLDRVLKKLPLMRDRSWTD